MANLDPFPNLKKRDRGWNDDLTTGATVKRQKLPFTGPDFAKPIRKIAKGQEESVFRKVVLPIEFGTTTTPKSHSLELASTFSTKTHTKDTGQQWTQGWLDLGGSTTYADILPDRISRKRANVESQILKKLALGESYVPKNQVSFINQTNNQNTLKGLISGWGRPALQSYLEEITARTALDVKDVGSGMRAMIYAAKLRLSISGKTDEPKFKQRLLNSYPQLLTATSTPAGGAALLNTNIHNEAQATGIYPTATQLATEAEIRRSHKEVNSAIKQRFKQKWNSIRAGGTAGQAGTWWGSVLGGNTSGERSLNVLLSQHSIKKKQVRDAYLSYKLARHGISHYG